MKRTIATTAAVLLGLTASAITDVASAQVIRRTSPAIQQQTYLTAQGQQTNGPNEQANGQQSRSQHDYFIASWIGADNLVEIEMNQFAGQHAASQEVKDFAQEMVRTHTDLANKINQAIANENTAGMNATNNRQERATGYRGLQGTAPANQGTAVANDAGQASNGQAKAGQADAPKSNPGQSPITNEAGGQTNIENKTQDGNQNQNKQSNGQANNQPNNQSNGVTTYQTSTNVAVDSMPGMKAVDLKREINDDLVRRVEEKLGQKKGEDFDRCFMTGQIAAHEHMLATLEVARNQVSPQLKTVLDEAVQTAEQHLKHAETVLSQLEQNQKK